MLLNPFTANEGCTVNMTSDKTDEHYSQKTAVLGLPPGQANYIFWETRGGPCQHGFMCGCKQWSNDINDSNQNMQSITIQFAVRVRKDYTDAP